MLGLFRLIFYFLCFNLAISSLVTIEDNAYKGIVVAIDEGIKDYKRHEIISAIQHMFITGSEFLYQATGKRAYFGEVTILLPKTWQKKRTDEEAGTESFDSADIRVTFPNLNRFNNMSYTMYSEECGKGGKFIHINEGHLLQTEPELILETLYGPPGKWLTKNWAIYRYGIYEEHGLIGSKKFTTFYDEADGFRITHCANDILYLGRRYNFLNGSSDCDVSTGYKYSPSENCYYSSIGDTMTSSIAFDQANTNIRKFCGSEPEFKHFTHPNTPHNEYCKKESTWDVIKRHDDFRNNNNPPKDITDTKPKFRFVIPPVHKRFVILIDTSTSMNGNHLKMVNTALEDAIMNYLPPRSAFGIVAFNETARVLYEMNFVAKIIDKLAIINSLPKSGSGSTCIACGLEKAIDMVKTFDPKGCVGTNIILLTDGNENERTRIKDVLHIVKRESVRVFPIAYGNYADEHLEDLSKETNGVTTFVAKTSSTSADDFYNSISPIFCEEDPSTANILCKIEKEAAKQNSLETPLSKADISSEISYFPIKPSPSMDLQLVKVEGWTNVNGKQINATTRRVSIYAYAHMKNNPLKNMFIFAEILLPNGTKNKIELFDNGIQPDLFKGDGVYSRYFLHFIGNGRYAVNLLVQGALKEPNYAARSGINPYTKHISIGSFKVTDKFNSAETDIYPPNAIEDLNVVHFDKTTHTVTLNWTAPGDDFDIGQAFKYELKYYDKFAKFPHRFPTISNIITEKDLISGSLTPSQSGHSEKISWKVPANFFRKYYSVYFAIRAVDENNNVAKLSNIAVLRMKPMKVGMVICRKVGSRFAHPTDCTRYLVCERSYGQPISMKCGPGTKFDLNKKHCVWKYPGEC